MLEEALCGADGVIHLAASVGGCEHVFNNELDVFRNTNRINETVFESCTKSMTLKVAVYVRFYCYVVVFEV